MPTQAQSERLQSTIMASPLLRPVLEHWDRVQLPDAWLAAGAIAQTVWNWAHGLPPEFGINDIDLIYHDASDLSEDAEAGHGRRIEERFGSVPARFDVKKSMFGRDIVIAQVYQDMLLVAHKKKNAIRAYSMAYITEKVNCLHYSNCQEK